MLLEQERCNRVIDALTTIRKKLRAVSGDFRFCFCSCIRAKRHYTMLAIRYRTISLNNFLHLPCNYYGCMFVWLMRVQQLFKRIYVYYAWLLKKIQRSQSSLTVSRKDIRSRYLKLLNKQLDDSVVTAAYGFISHMRMRRRRCWFSKKPDCYLLSWYQGIKFGTFVSFRCKFRYRRLRDRRRKRKLYKDYRKKLKKYKHSVNENMRLVRGKRKKPKKQHIVYYK